MRKALLLPALAVVSTLAVTAGARAGTECNGLPVCIPVAGPWVKIPPQTGPARRPTYYHQSCPRGSVIGGIDAEVTHRSIELSFAGNLGGPVSPGVTTATAAVFAATETGRLPLPTAFKPLLGCIPGGGGARGRTSRPPTRSLTSGAAEPGEPTIRRVRLFRLRVGRVTSGSLRCLREERLVGSAYAVAFHTRRAPTARQLSAVEARASVRGGRIRVTGRAGAAVNGARVRVQLQAVCARPNP